MSLLHDKNKAAKGLLEICVDDVAGLHAALAGGADRIELCSALAVGGLTPSAGFMAYAAGLSDVPVYAMIRPRAGDFSFSSEDVALMVADVEEVQKAGLQGIVIGAAGRDGLLDVACLERLIDAASGLGVTLHRVYDILPDPKRALDAAIALGVERILTSGGALSVDAGFDHLAATLAWSSGDITIMPGGGVSIDNVRTLLDMGFSEIHASCSQPQPIEPGAERLLQLGFVSASQKATSRDKVAALKAAMMAVKAS